MLIPGLYEQIINQELGRLLDNDSEHQSHVLPIEEANAARLLARYIMQIAEKSLRRVKEDGGDLHRQIFIVNQIVQTLAEAARETHVERQYVDTRAQQLMALFKQQRQLFGHPSPIRPETPLSESSLFTGSAYEPSLYTELKKELASADRVDMLVSFIKWSGLRLIIDDLFDLTRRGGRLRVITTSYMGATDIKAVETLSSLPHTDVRVSYDTKRTRLHAKSYVFYRDTGFSTAYVGSSNLSNAAIASGLEWNVRVAERDLFDTMQKIKATFDSYWHAPEFEAYDASQKERLSAALRAEKTTPETRESFLFDILPYPFQQEILDCLAAEREIRGFTKNLVIAATGTGKTVISALDYKRYVAQHPHRPHRLLFIAHREEILQQSLSCFRAVLKDPNFGDLFVGKNRPDNTDYLFMSIQTFHARSFHRHFSSDYYDYIVVDEFHHASAPTYRNLLLHVTPHILLGLTATPERMDGQDIFSFFDYRIAANIRLPEAIERKLLCPFHYFGVTDTVDLNDLRWSKGGYEKSELTRVYSLERATAERRARHIIKAVLKYVTDIHDVRGLGFCVSVEHAHFMADFFNQHTISSFALTGQSSKDDRQSAKRRLNNGKLRFLFVVDIYNEGVDIPEINTVLFLRPTESLTIFLQQLGRGLRHSDSKDCLTVLDFIGQANRLYNFEDKFSALLYNTNHSVTREIQHGFPTLPKGCYIQLERKAKEYILDNIRQSIGTRNAMLSRIASFESDTGKSLTLASFLDHYHLDIQTVLSKGFFSRLCVRAGVKKDFDEPLEAIISKALPRLCSIDSRRWIFFLETILDNKKNTPLLPDDFDDEKKRMLKMFYFSIWPDAQSRPLIDDAVKQINTLRASSVLCSDVLALLRYNYNRIDFIDELVDLGFACPLDLHCTYTRDQLLVAMDYDRPSIIREGVKFLPEKETDLFFITLNKSDKDYSPSTLYNDYSISDTLFFWQSQSTTSATSPTAKRYIHHRAKKSRILLFVRENKKDNGLASPYTFLGTAQYVSHEGSRPMNIIWRLDRPIPAKFLRKTNKLVIG